MTFNTPPLPLIFSVIMSRESTRLIQIDEGDSNILVDLIADSENEQEEFSTPLNSPSFDSPKEIQVMI